MKDNLIYRENSLKYQNDLVDFFGFGENDDSDYFPNAFAPTSFESNLSCGGDRFSSFDEDFTNSPQLL